MLFAKMHFYSQSFTRLIMKSLKATVMYYIGPGHAPNTPI